MMRTIRLGLVLALAFGSAVKLALMSPAPTIFAQLDMYLALPLGTTAASVVGFACLSADILVTLKVDDRAFRRFPWLAFPLGG